ncbi:hypothetical protein GCM10009588_07750 [Microbacterium phyllosphaerae]
MHGAILVIAAPIPCPYGKDAATQSVIVEPSSTSMRDPSFARMALTRNGAPRQQSAIDCLI